MIEIEKIDFVSIPTRDVARARWFYGEVLGLPTSANSADELEAPNLTLGLWEPERQDVAFAPNTSGIALRVAAAAARGVLERQGVDFLGDTVLHRRYEPLA